MDYINIVLKGANEGDAVFTIFDASGKLVYKKSFFGKFKRFTANIEGLAPGIYSVRLISTDHLFTEKFIKF